jgi:hypothetical protein
VVEKIGEVENAYKNIDLKTSTENTSWETKGVESNIKMGVKMVCEDRGIIVLGCAIWCTIVNT